MPIENLETTSHAKKSPKFVVVSGGVLSSLGKGVVTGSVALLLKQRGFKVTIVKCENYLNVDSGLINPIEHGDPFLCEDGTEADMDLGTYEKFLGQPMGKHNFVTMGQIYKQVIEKERSFGYNGEDVEVPHICDEIISRWMSAAHHDDADIVIIELGGTAGEYLNILYYEAARILRFREKQRVIHVHVGYLPTPSHIGEPKTKPTQLSVKTLNSLGIQPDFIVARSPKRMDQRRRDRFALFCNVEADHIIDSPDVDVVYEIPLIFAQQHFDELILQDLKLTIPPQDLSEWEAMITKAKAPKTHHARIAIVGKYLTTGEYQLKDSYAALIDALHHSAVATDTEIEIEWVDAQKVEALVKKNPDLTNADLHTFFGDIQGMIVPIGWGERGVEGKIRSIQFAREEKIPYLGLCYGMQLAVVEFARHIVGWRDAHTQEVNPNSAHQVIHMIPDQKRILENRAYGGTMRLGTWDCVVKPNTKAWEAYKEADQFTDEQKGLTAERHRHRYEFNDEFLKEIEANGLIISGRSVKENLVEIIELPTSMHPFFLGTQGHPEYKSTPLKPNAIFLAFLNAAKR
ncbi:CTP synthase [Candidatus Cerribacteria bacterium 'Amazon FNV 2010 28 9']|uniref:CTP synthase (glutamine hydrolyzing) n=1 Tax=Candidatus Cerribacteria bacterium 'Amazon FNV 2010 28 9' TaxID=2081795 RepID=A0A317JRF2_9BACT|nr:MAG: CTP synthase [Candidatus Cerribacteria bacterium 'Amazon FNV 2010 28 9']